ncbi:hypothetical protein NMY22_g14759 [Coprinellus aureogranulatus]|nr:hypothetical protein NMY22_g14759 [Coprinellus aureogranulatus]
MSDNNNSTTANVASAHGHHHHYHHHHHGHGHGGNYAEANKEYFNANADDFDNYPRAKERAVRTALAIREVVPLNKESSSVLEFACGTGLVCKEFLPYAKEVVGIDISEGVVNLCNKRFKELGANDGCFAVAADIVTEKGNVLPGRKFDLVFCASAYHHFESPEEITKLLADYVKQGGSLVVVDMLKTEGQTIDEERKAYVAHTGFSEEDMKQIFSQAGLEFVSYAMVPRDEEDIDVFIAKAVKAA